MCDNSGRKVTILYESIVSTNLTVNQHKMEPFIALPSSNRSTVYPTEKNTSPQELAGVDCVTRLKNADI